MVGRMNSFLSKFYGDDTPPAVPPVTPPPTPDPKPNEPRVFTQEEVNALLAENKRGLKKQIDDLQKTSGDAKAFQAKIKELNDALLTKEELAKQEADRLKQTYEEQLKTTAEEKAAWENRYKTQLFDVALSRAASKHDLYDPEQFGLILQKKSEIVPETDKEGKPTGEFKVLTKIEIDGKPLTLPMDEAIGKMREAGMYPNQFKVKGSPGTGVTLNNTPNPQISGNVKPGDMPSFLKQYEQLKKEGKIR